MKKGVIYVGYAVVIIAIITCALPIAVAQEEIIFEIDKENSSVVDNTLGKTWTLNEFEKEGELFENHVVVFNLSLNIVGDPNNWWDWESYELHLWSNIKNCNWKYDGKSYSGCQATVWDSRIDHYKHSINIVLIGRVPDVIRYGVKEPYFEGYDLTGIFENPSYLDLTVYDTVRGIIVQQIKGTSDGVHTIDFLSTTKDLVKIKEEIGSGLEIAHNADVNYPSEEIINDLLENGHPGWAYKIYKSLNIPSKERFEDVKKEISEKIEHVNKQGTKYPEEEDAIWNEYKRGNLDEALALAIWYEKQIPEDEPPWWIYLVIGILIGCVVGGISYHFMMKKEKEDRVDGAERLKNDLYEKVKGIKEKIEECIKAVSDTKKRGELRKIKNDLDEVERKLERKK